MNANTPSVEIVEQQNLLGGSDLLTLARSGQRKKKVRTVQVDGRFKVGFVAALALVVHHGKAQAGLDVPKLARCPRCGREGPTEPLFGTRVMGGERRPQSWCRSCRSLHLPPSRRTRAVQEDLGFMQDVPAARPSRKRRAA
jgi:hypothetical protein